MLKKIMLLTFLILNSSFSIAFADWFLPQTGQTTCYDSAGAALPSCVGTGQDGDLRTGAAWPNPRFTVNMQGDGITPNGTVTDNLTGLIWLKDPGCFAPQPWASALTSANTLASGACGLADGSTAGQWRLPGINELESLVNEEQASPAAWLNSQGFSNVQGNVYWSGSTYAYNTNYAWLVSMDNGDVSYGDKGDYGYVWPVR